jgi:hypothetical protein
MNELVILNLLARLWRDSGSRVCCIIRDLEMTFKIS